MSTSVILQRIGLNIYNHSKDGKNKNYLEERELKEVMGFKFFYFLTDKEDSHKRLDQEYGESETKA